MTMTALQTALELLERGFWPVPITAVDDPDALSPGKQPIGQGWGLDRHTRESLATVYGHHPNAGVGLRLGPESGIVDIEVENREVGGPTLLALFDGELPETMGWESARGSHLVFAWDERFARYKKAILKGPKLPGVELRLGWSTTNRQFQSVCPPSPSADGTPRKWNGYETPLPVPDCLFENLDRLAAVPAERADHRHAPRTRSVKLWAVEQRAVAYLQKCQPAVSGSGGHNQAFKVVCKVGPGFDLPVETAIRLIGEVYNPTCQPPWSEKELRHKVENAYDNELRRGWLLEAKREDERPTPEPRGGDGGGDGPEAAAPEDGPDEFPDDPFRLARSFIENRATPDGWPTLRYWLEEWHEWDGRRYQVLPTAEVRAAVVRHAKVELDLVAKETGRTAGKVTTGLVGNILQALTGLALLSQRECPEQPAWLDDRGDDLPSPREVIPAANGLIHLPALVEGRQGHLPATPRFFSPNCLSYEFHAHAPRPAHWLQFLASVWPEDPESIDSLQEWFGYLLTPDTSQQKIMLLIGPTRSGKGTITRVITSLLGDSNVVCPTLSGLANTFGLSPLIGKTLAVFPDARLGGRADGQVIVERLLSISGEDSQTIDRKHLSSLNGRLMTRFMLVSNELPRLGDSSGAITARTVILRLTKSFLGHEDTDLYHKLAAEMPSILLWSIAGWARLRRRGRFTQPESGLELLEDMRELSSPIATFVADKCDLAPELRVEIKKLYAEWRTWCTEQGKDRPGDEQGFGRMIRASLPTLKVSRGKGTENRQREYLGIALKTSF